MAFTRCICWGLLLCFSFLSQSSQAHGLHDKTKEQATYLGNAGLLIESGGEKVLFDPFFHNGFGIYQLVPRAMRQRIMAGEGDYADVKVVFISHVHSDHFDANDVAKYLAIHPQVKLVAPQQAISQLKPFLTSKVADERLFAIDLSFGDSPIRQFIDGVRFDVVRIPHAGWPGRADVENLVYRVHMSDGAVVMHMGDADPDVTHYLPYRDHWQKHQTDAAFPPYWFFYSIERRDILNTYLNVETSIGIHVPLSIPEFLINEKHPYFSVPGEHRSLSHSH